MIHARLNELEGYIEKNEKGALHKLKTIERFREWLKQIDHRVEVIPVNNLAMLNNLLISLKGEILTIDELDLLKFHMSYSNLTKCIGRFTCSCLVIMDFY